MLTLFRYFSIVLLCACNFLIPQALANPMTTVEVAIDNNEQQIDPLLSKGLTTVLTRLTGNPKITEQAAITEILKKPNDFLENYTQQTNPARLVISFDQTAIEQALAKADISYWQNRRPTIMTWWLNENNTDSSLVDDAQASAKIISNAANTQGFPLRFPLADLNEQALANKTNFNADNPKEILQASEQYAANAILIVYMQQTDNNYQATWRLWLSANDTKPLTQGNATANSEAKLAEQVFTAINPALANVFIIKTSATETLEILIKDVDFSRYVQVNNLMNSFEGKVIETSGTTILYQVKADPAQIKAQLGLLNFVEEKVDTPTATTNQPSTTMLTFKASNN
ncbi:DUF2066 domain-containing protein [Entomomonas asaccharolytica]|uniref:DUF2066 domain-containing protein n=1 Tax=Entomomonas asaccharolytica TaxID=2785331 RepID=A0A974NFW2_9GAMM|nr:DUF2066 domain-containing protein [Entomomonas asaccharolytica]QQP85808.1 DUF2066 domain-containing protein [Entomomonas asaccharolytica]